MWRSKSLLLIFNMAANLASGHHALALAHQAMEVGLQQVLITSGSNEIHLKDNLAHTFLDPDNPIDWSLDRFPNANSTDHLVFETVHSLLQHWPNTRMRNGHTIVPGIIPKGTLLYHGKSYKEPPTGPEWYAMDPEHSYLFSRNYFNRSSGGWQLTFMATRPLRMIYFDGNSAAKIPVGSMDTQDLITWGRAGTGVDMWAEEAKRLHDLCEWGKNFGVDGFVRMEMDFEIMLCDSTSGVRMISSDYLASKWTAPVGYSSTEGFEVMNAGSWHNRFPGETRIQLDLPGLVSFYDTELAPSLVPIRVGLERWDHRAINISSEDLFVVKSRLEENLSRPEGASSGIDWNTLIQVIVDRYSQRLELTRYLLSSSVAGNADEIFDLAKKTQAQLRIMLTPYLSYSARLPTDPSNNTGLDWTIPIYKLCSTAHTRSMESFEFMTDSERLLLRAVRGTSREICRVIITMWAAGVYAGIDPSLNAKDSPDIAELTRLRRTWTKDLERLMAWLDWSEWVKCSPACSVEETCYLPTWPLGFPWWATNPPHIPFPHDDGYSPHESGLTWHSIVMENIANGLQHATELGPDEWLRPQPKCVRRLEPYTY